MTDDDVARRWDGSAWRSKVLTMQAESLPKGPYTIHHGLPPDASTEEWWIESATGRLVAGKIESAAVACLIVKALSASPLPEEIAGLLALREGLPEGPWTHDPSEGYGYKPRVHGGGRLICEVGNAQDELWEQWELEARAIAALPSLFAALQQQARENERLKSLTVLAPLSERENTLVTQVEAAKDCIRELEAERDEAKKRIAELEQHRVLLVEDAIRVVGERNELQSKIDQIMNDAAAGRDIDADLQAIMQINSALGIERDEAKDQLNKANSLVEYYKAERDAIKSAVNAARIVVDHVSDKGGHGGSAFVGDCPVCTAMNEFDVAIRALQPAADPSTSAQGGE